MKAILYDWGGFNVWLFHCINDLRGSFIDAFMQLGTVAGMHQLFWLYLACIILARLRLTERLDSRGQTVTAQQSTVWLIVIASFMLAYFIDNWLVGALKHFFNFPRPPLALPPATMHLLTHKADLQHSLPSGHTIFAATIATSLWPVAGVRLRLVLALFVIWVGLSRISLGIHFPADVVYGAVIGVSLVILLRQLLWLLVKNRQRAT